MLMDCKRHGHKSGGRETFFSTGPQLSFQMQSRTTFWKNRIYCLISGACVCEQCTQIYHLTVEVGWESNPLY